MLPTMVPTYVNFKKKCSKDDPFVLASQVHQVYYSQDPLEKDIQYVMKRVPRDLFEFEEALSEETYWEEPIDSSSNNMPSFDANHIHVGADVENGSKKPEIASKSILTSYEKVRSMTIEKNAQKFRELGLDKIAQQLLEKSKNFAKGKENVNSNVDDPDYVPDKENCDLEEFEKDTASARFVVVNAGSAAIVVVGPSTFDARPADA
uniref:DUF4216 domain-containing protein n=1 Tax=Chenopodium quinoa TaxID=63459 RepID=A0A803N8D5_CHEQI